MNVQLELMQLANEERYRRLLAEATQLRLLRAQPADLPQSKAREFSGLWQSVVSIWRRLTQPPANPRPPKWFSPDFNQ